MRLLRRHLLRCAPATLLLFVAMVAAPRPGFVVHSHGGGEHHHVHFQASRTGDLEIDRLLAEALGEPLPSHHRHQVPGERPSFERHEASGAIHCHTQTLCHLDTTDAAPALTALPFVAPARIDSPTLPVAAPLGRTRARAPPILL